MDDVPLQQLAEDFGTPLYAYSWVDIERRFTTMRDCAKSVNGKIYYAVKANSNLSILNRLVKLGSGFDIVSGGELERVIAAGGHPSTVLFSGVGKTREELAFAAKLQIGAFNVESEAELVRLVETCAGLHIKANVMFRVNPNVAVETHPFITTGLKENKFGISATQVERLYKQHFDNQWLNLLGIACHIGSQIDDPAPYIEALRSVFDLRKRLIGAGCRVDHIDLGGGFGIQYVDENEFQFEDLVAMLSKEFQSEGLEFGFEPGRSIVGNAGVLLTRVEYLKPAEHPGEKNFVVVDAAMNDLIRPPLYDAHHRIVPTNPRPESSAGTRWDVVGPVCESTDFLGRSRELSVKENDVLAVFSAGAYGFSLSSNYNSRRKCAEVLVDHEGAHLIRSRESFNDLINHERIA